VIHGEAKIMRRRAALACPDVKALRQRLTSYVGLPVTQDYLGRLVGCSGKTVLKWERGTRPLPVFAVRLAAVEKALAAKTRTLMEELGACRSSPQLSVSIQMMPT
jgi:DNA-binding XRE family transcriptional regulator